MLSASADEEVVLCRRADDASADPVVVRLLSEERADATIAASAAVDPRHIAQLLDLFSTSDDRFGLVAARLPRGSLAELLAHRAALSPGEAATIVISAARGVGELHRAGFAHGALRATGLLFDAAGTPVLAGVGFATALTAETRLVDERALAVLAATVLGRVPGSDALLRRLDQSPGGMAPNVCEEQLFAFSEPCPVEFPPAAAPTIEQLLPSRTAPPEKQPPAPPAGRRSLPGEASAAIRGWAARVGGQLRTVRRRVWVPAVLAGVGLAAALLLVPQRSGGAAGDVPVGAPSAEATAPQQVFVPPDASVLRAEDLAAAARALAGARDTCLASAADCLGEVDQAGSALLEADRLRAGPPAPTVPTPDAEPAVQRVGDAALVTFAQHTLLLVRAEGAWRLRDVFAAETRSAR